MTSNYELIITADGSPTLRDHRNETFHSHHGAAQETRHVFISNGLDHYRSQTAAPQITIAEVGFGTGLNAAMAWQYAQFNKISLTLVSCETHPLPQETIHLYSDKLSTYDTQLGSFHRQIINADWDLPVQFDSLFTLTKHHASADSIQWPLPIHVVWFDAFSPDTSPDCWTEATLSPLIQAMADNAVLTTYCAKGSVRRLFQSLGLTTKRLQGPPGKREMVRGTPMARPQSEIAG